MELLSGPRFSQLLAWAEAVYDLVLIDSPPALATSDAAIIGRLVDGVILVVQPAKNRRRVVTRVVERLGLMKIPLLGLSINRTGLEDDRGYYGYHGYDGYEYESGENDDSVAMPEMADREVGLSLAEGLDGDGDGDDEEPPSMILPRRVA